MSSNISARCHAALQFAREGLSDLEAEGDSVLRFAAYGLFHTNRMIDKEIDRMLGSEIGATSTGDTKFNTQGALEDVKQDGNSEQRPDKGNHDKDNHDKGESGDKAQDENKDKAQDENKDKDQDENKDKDQDENGDESEDAASDASLEGRVELTSDEEMRVAEACESDATIAWGGGAFTCTSLVARAADFVAVHASALGAVGRAAEALDICEAAAVRFSVWMSKASALSLQQQQQSHIDHHQQSHTDHHHQHQHQQQSHTDQQQQSQRDQQQVDLPTSLQEIDLASKAREADSLRAQCAIAHSQTLFAAARAAAALSHPLQDSLPFLDRALAVLADVPSTAMQDRVVSIKMQIYASKVILYCSKKNAAQIATQYLQMKEILHSVARMNLQESVLDEIEEAHVSSLMGMVGLDDETKAVVMAQFGEQRAEIERVMKTISDLWDTAGQEENKGDTSGQASSKRSRQEPDNDQARKTRRLETKDEDEQEGDSKPQCPQQ
eukprot:TRINITY_DN5766_c0_g2_i1.p1 TRINITY_DN5766_c0_g2~~TRINITY_DN5766_c0_g2_i1.p1  ORF type:complete len:496 (+),score=114.65 TRINITY_DN5766_c0_g2_i1:58-1545(+)